MALLEPGEPPGEVAAAYMAKGLLRAVHATADRTKASPRLRRGSTSTPDERCRRARSPRSEVHRWGPLILARYTTELTNGPTGRVKRVRRGFRNFENYRPRLLLHCGVSRKADRVLQCHPSPTLRPGRFATASVGS